MKPAIRVASHTFLISILVLSIAGCASPTPPPPVVQTVVVSQTVAPAAAAASGVPIPTIPAPVAVALDAKTTAFLILDITSVVCTPRKSCVASLPAIASLLKRAREANVMVVYSDTPTAGSTVLPEVAQQAGDPKVTGRADKFFGTNLDDILKQKGITTTLMVGSASNGAVLYTAFGANLRNYTVVVAQDGISTDDAFANFLTRYQLLNQPGFSNPDNKPLTATRVTLTESALVGFK